MNTRTTRFIAWTLMVLMAVAGTWQDPPAPTTPADAASGQDASPRDILVAMLETYASVTTYRDTGTATGKSLAGRVEASVAFATTFVRPDRYRYESETKSGDKQVVWAGGDRVVSWSSGAWRSPQPKEWPSLKEAPSGYVSRWLLPEVFGPIEIDAWLDPDSLELLGEEDVDGVKCLKIRGESAQGRSVDPLTGTWVEYGPTTLWIDRETLLMRKERGEMTTALSLVVIPEYQSDPTPITRDVTRTYAPEANVEIPEEALAYIAPRGFEEP